MAGNACPRLVWILIRLAQNWAICRNRYERFEKRQQRAGASAEPDDDEGEALWSAYHDHPFPGMVRFVDHHIGFGQDTIRATALKEFDGAREMVAALNALDDKGVTAELFEKLRGECPDIVERLFANKNDAKATAGPGSSPLVDLLDRAGKVFGLAWTLGQEFEKDHKSQGPVVMAGVQPPAWQQHGERIKEFVAAALGVRDIVQNPPDGLDDVVKQLREAGKYAKLLTSRVNERANDWDILDLWPNLNQVAHNGYEAVKAARQAARLDDPFAFLDDAPQPSQSANDIPTNTQSTADDNVTARIPQTDDEAELLKPAIAELLQTISETWSEFDFDTLTAIQSNALFLLTAAGMVERRGWIRTSVANHPTCFELRFQATGEAGFVRAMEHAAAIEYEAWSDTYREWCKEKTGNRWPLHAEGFAPQDWRLTGEGILARGELDRTKEDAKPTTVFDFVLKRGFFGPGYLIRKQLSGRPFTDDDQRTIAHQIAAGNDPARLARPPVAGEGRLIEYRKIEKQSATPAVELTNWREGADTFADAFGTMLGPLFEQLQAKADATKGHLGADDPSALTPPDTTPKRRGRRKASDATVKREAELAAKWERARDANVYKADFAKDNGMTVKKLDALLDRVAWRQRNSE